MQGNWFKRKINIFFIVFILLFGSLFLPIIYSLSELYSKTEKVEANVLVVEGWLPHYSIEMTIEEFKNNGYDYIITTGLNSSDYYMVGMNGYLIFYPQNMEIPDNGMIANDIEIVCYSELSGENSAEFNIYINDSKIADFTAEKRKLQYAIHWQGRVSDIDSIIVEFVNDKVGEFGDRNLYVKEIIINRKLRIPYQNNSEYDIAKLDGKRRVINNFSSYAQLAKNRLISSGIDSSLIKAIPGRRVRLNRTLSSALAFRDWLYTSNIKVTGINIVTMGTHAKRTFMTYNKLLDNKYSLGIISLPDYRANYSRRYKVLKTLRETLGIIYYWFILLPY